MKKGFGQVNQVGKSSDNWFLHFHASAIDNINIDEGHGAMICKVIEKQEMLNGKIVC